MANDEHDVTVRDLSLTALWELAEAESPRDLGPAAAAAAKIGFFTGAASVLHLLPTIYRIDARSLAGLRAADVVAQQQ